jgi:hypothetical protein
MNGSGMRKCYAPLRSLFLHCDIGGGIAIWMLGQWAPAIPGDGGNAWARFDPVPAGSVCVSAQMLLLLEAYVFL